MIVVCLSESMSINYCYQFLWVLLLVGFINLQLGILCKGSHLQDLTPWMCVCVCLCVCVCVCVCVYLLGRKVGVVGTLPLVNFFNNVRSTCQIEIEFCPINKISIVSYQSQINGKSQLLNMSISIY